MPSVENAPLNYKDSMNSLKGIHAIRKTNGRRGSCIIRGSKVVENPIRQYNTKAHAR